MSSSLYLDAAVSTGSVFFVGVFAKYLWFIDLSMEIDQKPFVLDIFLSSLTYVYLPFMVICFIFGEVTKNLSQVDKIWSIITPCFCWYVTFLEASYHGMNFNHKLVMMSGIVTVWGVRLSYQFFRKGGYTWKIWTGEEDYRWQVVREEMPIFFESRTYFTLFNFGFLCVYQLLVLFLVTAGVMLATILSNDGDRSRNSIAITDLVLGSVMFFCIFIESISDYQQQSFQLEKRRRLKEGVSLSCSVNHFEVGFLTKGLFSYSRHPNFTAEQAIWFTFYLFSVKFGETKRWYQIGGIFNISIIGLILLIILFMKSTDLTEKISAKKYPLYKIYQHHVHRLLDLELMIQKLVFGKDPDESWLNVQKAE